MDKAHIYEMNKIQLDDKASDKSESKAQQISKTDKAGYVTKRFPYTTLMTWEFFFHKHCFWEIIICLKGTAFHFIDGQKYTFSEGDIIVMKPENTHDYKIQDKDDYAHYDLYADSSTMREVCDSIDKQLFGVISADKKPLHLSADKESVHYLKYRLEKLNSLQSNSQFDALAAICHKNILLTVCGLLIESVELERSNVPMWLSELMSQMAKSEILCGSLSDVVRLSNFSHGHLCKLFKKYTGERLIDYFTKLKIDYSTTLLKNKNLNILDISTTLGYNSLSHFIRLFKMYNGTTPKAYRRTLYDI